MQVKHRIKRRTALWATVGLICLTAAPAIAGEPGWWTQQKRDCNLPSGLAYNNWDGTCNNSSSGSSSAPGYDNGAAQRAQAAAAAQRAHQQAEAERIERERQAEEKRQKDAAFIRDRDAAAGSLKGSSGGAMNQLKGLSGTSNLGLKGSGFDTGDSGLKGLKDSVNAGQSSPAKAAPHTDTAVVDARNVPTGLPKSVEKAIPNTPAGNRVRKGFQAIAAHDWNVALAWFQDALSQEPGSPGIQRLVDLAQFTLQRQSGPAAKPTPVTGGNAGKTSKAAVSPKLNRSLHDYYQDNPPKFFKPVKPGEEIQSDSEWLNEKEPAWKSFFRLFAPRFKVQADGAIICIGIRG